MSNLGSASDRSDESVSEHDSVAATFVTDDSLEEYARIGGRVQLSAESVQARVLEALNHREIDTDGDEGRKDVVRTLVHAATQLDRGKPLKGLCSVLIGPRRCGKSTLLAAMADILPKYTFKTAVVYVDARTLRNRHVGHVIYEVVRLQNADVAERYREQLESDPLKCIQQCLRDAHMCLILLVDEVSSLYADREGDASSASLNTIVFLCVSAELPSRRGGRLVVWCTSSGSRLRQLCFCSLPHEIWEDYPLYNHERDFNDGKYSLRRLHAFSNRDSVAAIAVDDYDAPERETPQFELWLRGRYLASRGLAGYLNMNGQTSKSGILYRTRQAWTEVEPIWTLLMRALTEVLPAGRTLAHVLQSVRDDPFNGELFALVTAPRRIQLDEVDRKKSLRAFFNVLDMGLISSELELPASLAIDVGFGSIGDPDMFLQLAAPELRYEFLGSEYPVSYGRASSLPVQNQLFEAVKDLSSSEVPYERAVAEWLAYGWQWTCEGTQLTFTFTPEDYKSLDWDQANFAPELMNRIFEVRQNGGRADGDRFGADLLTVVQHNDEYIALLIQVKGTKAKSAVKNWHKKYVDDVMSQFPTHFRNANTDLAKIRELATTNGKRFRVHRVLVCMANISDAHQTSLLADHSSGDVEGEPTFHEIICGLDVWGMLPARWCDAMARMAHKGYLTMN